MIYKKSKVKEFYHFVFDLFIITLFFAIQSTILPQFHSGFLHIDLVTVAVIYMCLKHGFVRSFLEIVFAVALMQSSSLAPSYFFLVYYFLVFVFAHLFSRAFSLKKYTEKLFVFLLLYIFKFIFLYLTLTGHDAASFLVFVGFAAKETISTGVVIFPVIIFLMKMDNNSNMEQYHG